MDDFSPAPRLPMNPGERRVIQICAVVFLGLLVAGLLQDWTPRKWGVLVAILAWAPLLVLHELGHALAARLVGWSVIEIVIGYGRQWKAFTWGDTKVRLKAAPVEGYVLPSAGNLQAPRLKNAWVYFGGPATQLLVLLLLWMLSGGKLFHASDQLGLIVLQGIGISACLGLFYTLIPLPLAGGATDGLGMILSFSLPDEHFQAQLSYPVAHRARQHLIVEETDAAHALLANGLSRYPGDTRLLALRSISESQSGNEAAATATLEEALAEGATSTSAIAQAWDALREPGGGNGLFAVHPARQAVEQAPNDLLARCLLGWALLQVGRSRDAYRQLMTAYKRATVPEEEGMCLALLALAAEDAGPGGADPRIPHDAVARFTGALDGLPLGPTLRRTMHDRGLLGVDSGR